MAGRQLRNGGRRDLVLRPHAFGETVVPAVAIYRVSRLTMFANGPWDAEPDKAAWWDAASGLACIIRRERNGALGGYVAVPPGHPLYGFGERAVPAGFDLEVHGGIKYAEECRTEEPEETSVCHVPGEALDSVDGTRHGASADLWWFGFRCDECYDHVPQSGFHGPRDSSEGRIYRDQGYVYQQTIQLAAQLAAIGRGDEKPELHAPPPSRVLDPSARNAGR